MSVIDQARAAAGAAADKQRVGHLERQQKLHAEGEDALRKRLVMSRYGENPDPPYDGEVKTIRPFRYEVDGVEFSYSLDGRGIHHEVSVVQTCPCCGSECLTSFMDLKNLGQRLALVEAGKQPSLHSCREGDVASLCGEITRTAQRRGVGVADLMDEIGRNL